MYERTIETSASPHIIVEECRGSLVVKGGAEDEVTLRVDAEEHEVIVEREGETLTLTLPDQTSLICPTGSSLTVDRVLGNLLVDDLTGQIACNSAHGNATLRAAGPTALVELSGNLAARDVNGNLEAQDVKGNARVQDLKGQLILGKVGGNLSARDVEGDLKARVVKGNARIQDLEGYLTLEQVYGNLGAQGVTGGMSLPEVRGNARLGPPFAGEAVYHVNARGNLTVSVPADASLRLTVHASGHVRASVPDLVLDEIDRGFEGMLGSGEATLEAQARGNVSFRPAESSDSRFEARADLEGLGAQIEWQVNEAVARMTSRLEESLGRIDSTVVQRHVEQATDQARQSVEQARQKAEQAAERARMRAERAERRWRRASGQPPRSEREAASDEERLRVLRMVEEGRLTPEQASELLAALEGE